MAYFGPHLEPTRDDLSVWSWLFEHGNAPLSPDRGFRDADSGAFLSHVTLRDTAISASASLARDYGVRSLQTVAIVGRNSLAYPVALMAASRLGAVVTLLPCEAKAVDLAYYFWESSTVLVFSDDEALDQVREACESVPQLDNSRILSLDMSGIRRLTDRGHPTVDAWKLVDKASLTCAFLAFTSGTTGKPKAVMISHANAINQLRQMRQFTPVGLSSTMLGILPFYHITGLVHLLHLPSMLDQDLVVVAKFDMQRMMKVVVQYRCTELWLVPPLLIRLLNDKAAQGYDMSFVEQFNTGAAPLTGEVVTQLAQKFPRVRIRQSWGMTETTSCLTTTPPGFAEWKHAAKVGKLVPGTAVRVVDPETGVDVPRGQTGELWAKGPQVSMGYLNCPKETSETYMPGGYLRTGDLGAIDDEGFIVITDRIKEMIKVRGQAIAPAELEDILMSHPAVSDAAIIGVPHAYSGEVPRAYVVLRHAVTDSEALVKDLDNHILARKAKHFRLSGGVEFMTEIPKSASGKILRRTLRDMFKAGEETKAKL